MPDEPDILRTPRGSKYLLLCGILRRYQEKAMTQTATRLGPDAADPAPAIERAGPVWRVKYGAIAQIGTLITALGMFGAGAAYLRTWDRERRAESVAQGEASQVMAALVQSVNEHTRALAEMSRTMTDVRVQVGQIQGKLDRMQR